MRARIAVLPGDGIGPEVIEQAVRVLETVARRFKHELRLTTHPIGGAALSTTGVALPDRTLEACREADAVLLGAVGDPQWDDVEAERRPERALLGLREALATTINIRPTRIEPTLAQRSPLRERVARGVDLVIVRELGGGLYFGAKAEGKRQAQDVSTYTAPAVELVARHAARLARERQGRVVSIDKANVLATSRLWRRTVQRIFDDEFTDVALEHTLVDAAAMRLVTAPSDFDVLLTENLFGDILSDTAAALTGTLGLAPSASLARTGPGIFEPLHGSAPDLAGTGTANPFAAILSGTMLLRSALQLEREARLVEAAVRETVGAGVLPADLAEGPPASTSAVGDAVCAAVRRANTPRLATTS